MHACVLDEKKNFVKLSVTIETISQFKKLKRN